jgi:hypothetical protein
MHMAPICCSTCSTAGARRQRRTRVSLGRGRSAVGAGAGAGAGTGAQEGGGMRLPAGRDFKLVVLLSCGCGVELGL